MEKRSIEDTPEDIELVSRPDMQGMHVWWLVSKEETGSTKVVFDIASFPPGKAHQLHRHPNCEEVTYVIKGTGVHLFDGGEQVQRQGEAVFIGEGEWHGFRNDTDETVVIVGVYGGVGNIEEAGYEEHPAAVHAS
jgi:quercetin dioxygenase-like cupin family protein